MYRVWRLEAFLIGSQASLTSTAPRPLCADSASPALVSYRQMMQGGPNAMVAAARSAVSMPLAQLGALDTMPQCSYWSSSPSLSDKQLYPYCAPSFAPDLEPIARLLS
jgi:hypothetical protein